MMSFGALKRDILYEIDSVIIVDSIDFHYIDVTMTTIASQITSLTVVYSTVYSDADQRKHQSSPSPALCVGNSPGPVNSPQKGPATRKMLPFDDVIMYNSNPSAGIFFD